MCSFAMLRYALHRTALMAESVPGVLGLEMMMVDGRWVFRVGSRPDLRTKGQ